MIIKDKIKLFKKLYELETKANAFIDTIPSSISTTFIDNELINSLYSQTSLMRQAIFGNDTESVEWFMFEWKPGYEVSTVDGPSTKINNIDDYIAWIVKNEDFKD